MQIGTAGLFSCYLCLTACRSHSKILHPWTVSLGCFRTQGGDSNLTGWSRNLPLPQLRDRRDRPKECLRRHTAVKRLSMGEKLQEQRLSSASIKFLWLRQIHAPSGISPALDNASSTLLSCCSKLFFLSAFSLSLYIFFRWSRSVTTTVNKSQRRQAFACWLF